MPKYSKLIKAKRRSKFASHFNSHLALIIFISANRVFSGFKPIR